MRSRDLVAKRAAIIGLAREGKALARFLGNRGVDVTVSDLKGEEELREAVQELADLPVRFALGGHPAELLEADVIYVSPGVALDIPFLMKARVEGIPLSSEPRLFVELCPAQVIGVTGSSGKSTTVALTGKILEEAGFHTHVGGNIGAPLLQRIDEIEADHKVVTELSSFQLEMFGTDYGLTEGVSPPVAAVMNITPNHLDRHMDMEAYVRAKVNIVKFQRPDDYAVLGCDNPVSWDLRTECAGQVLGFSLKHEVARGAYRSGRTLHVRTDQEDCPVCELDELKLLGEHNVENVLAACAIAGIVGASVEAMRAAVTTFTGIEHRLELVAERKGVRYFNDSIATSPERSMAAVKCFREPLILLAGGRDKHLPWGEWADMVARKVKHVVLFGEAEPLIADALDAALHKEGAPQRGHDWIHDVATLEQAVETAAELAGSGEVVLLSPGGTSFDAFVDFAERGDRFRQLIVELG